MIVQEYNQEDKKTVEFEIQKFLNLYYKGKIYE